MSGNASEARARHKESAFDLREHAIIFAATWPRTCSFA